jgi:hypothetical protein
MACRITVLTAAMALFPAADPDAAPVQQLRRHEATGRPAGSARFVQRLERQGRVLRPRTPGPPKN